MKKGIFVFLIACVFTCKVSLASDECLRERYQLKRIQDICYKNDLTRTMFIKEGLVFVFLNPKAACSMIDSRLTDLNTCLNKDKK